MERTWKADYEKFARTARENVAATLDNMDYPALERAAELILAAKAAGKRLHISGIGKPAHLAGYAACAGEIVTERSCPYEKAETQAQE